MHLIEHKDTTRDTRFKPRIGHVLYRIPGIMWSSGLCWRSRHRPCKAIFHQRHSTRELFVTRRYSSSSIDEVTDDDRRRIYIHGSGNKGCFMAFCLATKPNPPPITLLVANRERIKAFEEEGKKIRIYTDGKWFESGGVDIELLEMRHGRAITEMSSGPASFDSISSQLRVTVTPEGREVSAKEAFGGECPPKPKASQRPIFNLITTIRSPQAARSMVEVQHRLGPDSTVIAMQDGLGVLEEVFGTCFPDPRTRPDFRLAFISHDARYQGKGLRIVWSGIGVCVIGPLADGSVSKVKGDRWRRTQHSQYLLDEVSSSPILDCREVDQRSSIVMRYRKLIIDAVIGPLATAYSCENKDLLSKPGAPEILEDLVTEAWAVMRHDVAGTYLQGVHN
ncbi:uncharacterized protein LY89DRAFT_654901 [Mollisia scopiformis]|uniref:Ketopantoate reductase C-terminal domain-containing protein n=1 Tax=Mollisia scopiformis TaxID=149040 RepID=A0A194WT92_MOLSC|nr:uncharacterized protein LY89DRAFT_654901 [Mollisia scopiformis]KUJ11166.1 hypothetical protein LY89DRAFT_654901 [Mollisia scopiformis]